MQGKTTLKDLSKLLNLSISTISKALNNSSEISEETRIKVLELAKSRNYSPNRLAQSLKANKTRTLGVIVPDVLAHFFAKAVHGIEATASKHGYKVFICLSNESLEKEAESIQTLINGNVDGVIMSLSKETQSLENYNHFEDAIKYNLPVALFDRTTSRLVCDKVSIDDKLAAKDATKHLLRSGCEKIVFLSTIHGTSVGKKRHRGYQKAMLEEGLEDFAVRIDDYTTFEDSLLTLLKSRKVDGIVAADELSAISVMRYGLKHKFKIPENFSVIGFTNGILGDNFVPSLTTVDQRAEEQGALAAEILINKIEERIPGEPVTKILSTSIIAKESTLPLKSTQIRK